MLHKEKPFLTPIGQGILALIIGLSVALLSLAFNYRDLNRDYKTLQDEKNLYLNLCGKNCKEVMNGRTNKY